MTRQGISSGLVIKGNSYHFIDETQQDQEFLGMLFAPQKMKGGLNK